MASEVTAWVRGSHVCLVPGGQGGTGTMLKNRRRITKEDLGGILVEWAPKSDGFLEWFTCGGSGQRARILTLVTKRDQVDLEGEFDRKSMDCPECHERHVEIREGVALAPLPRSDSHQAVGLAGRSKRKRHPGVSCPGMLNMIEVDREDDCDSPRGLSFRQRTDNVINNMKMLGDAYKYTLDDARDISKFSQRGQNEQRAMSFSKVADILRCMMPKPTDYIVKVVDGRERGREASLRIRREADDKDWEGFPSGIGKGHILQDIKIAFDLQGEGQIIPRLSTIHASHQFKIMKELQLVFGVGKKTSDKLYRAGIRSVHQLREELLDHDVPTHHIREALGQRNQKALEPTRTFLKEFDDLHEKVDGEYQLRRVLRCHVERVKEYIETLVSEHQVDPMLFVPCGSYRRGKPDAGDIDFAIFPKSRECDQVACGKLLGWIVDKLTEKGVVQSIVAADNHAFWSQIGSRTRGFQEGGNFPQARCFMGLCKLPEMQHWCRIDMWIHPLNQYPYAIMTYTGSAHFNRSLRLFAKKRGLSLNCYGLYRREQVQNDQQAGWEHGLVDGARECKTEKDVFRLLGVDFVEPAERNAGIPVSAWEKIDGAGAGNEDGLGEEAWDHDFVGVSQGGGGEDDEDAERVGEAHRSTAEEVSEVGGRVVERMADGPEGGGKVTEVEEVADSDEEETVAGPQRLVPGELDRRAEDEGKVCPLLSVDEDEIVADSQGNAPSQAAADGKRVKAIELEWVGDTDDEEIADSQEDTTS